MLNTHSIFGFFLNQLCIERLKINPDLGKILLESWPCRSCVCVQSLFYIFLLNRGIDINKIENIYKMWYNIITSTGNSKLCNLPRNIWMAIMMPTFYIHTRFPYNQLHTGKFCCLDLGLVEPCPCIVC